MIRKTTQHLLLLASMLLTGILLTAQTVDNNKPDIVSEIFKNRLLLKENIISRNFINVEKLYESLELQTSKSSFAALNYREQILILTWLKKYEKLIQKALTIPIEQKKEEAVLKLSVNDFLEETLINQTTQSIADIVDDLKNSSLEESRKLFTEIVIKWSLKDSKSAEVNQSTVNELSREYLEQYPKGEHATVIKTTFQSRDKTGDFGYSTMIGVGANFNDPKYNDYFNTTGLLSLDFDYHIRQYAIGVSALTYNTTTATDILLADQSVWNKNSSTNNLILSLHAAYKPWQTNKSALILRAGYQNGWILPIGKDTEDNEPLDEYSVKLYGVRLSAAYSYVLLQRTVSTLDPTRQNISRYGIQVQYAMGITKYNHEINGVSISHAITLGFYLAGFNKQD